MLQQTKDKYFRPLEEDLQEYDPMQLYRQMQGRMTQQDYAESLGIAYYTFRRWWYGKNTPDRLARRRAYELQEKYKQRGWIN